MAEHQNLPSGLPWGTERGERRRFLLVLAVMLAVFLPPAFLIPTLKLPEPERTEVETIPPQLARLVEQPEPPEPVTLPEPEPEPEPVELDTSEPESPTPAIAEAVEEIPPEPATIEPEQTVEQARETASRSGLLAMKDQLASMRAPEPERVDVISANVGGAGEDKPADLFGADPQRDTALAGSGGVRRESAPQTEVALAGHDVREFEVAQDTAPEPAQAPDAGPGKRAMSNIRQVFEAQKTALYSLYRRELRQDPTLEGKVTLELVIEPDGSVSSCSVVSSELDNETLEQRIATRVRLFNFGEDDVETRTVKFPIDFLPG